MSMLQILSVVSSVAVLVTVFVVIWHRRRITEYIARTPPPKPLKRIWIAPLAGAVLPIAFALSLFTYMGIHLTLPLLMIIGAAAVIAFAAGTAFTFTARRQHTWKPTQRYVFGLGLILVGAFFVLESLFFFFFHV
jgi:hypothetical protein